MPDTETDTGVQDPQAAAAEDLGEQTEQDATAQETGDDKGQDAAGEEKTVPLAALEAERAKRQAAEAQTQSLTSQFEAMQQQNAQPQQQTQASFLKEKFGLESYDQVTVEQMEAWVTHIEQKNAIATQQVNMAAKTQRFIAGKTDFADKVGIYGATGFAPSAEFQKAMVADPSLAEDYLGGSMTVQSAYRAVTAYRATNELAVMKATAKEQKAQKETALKTGPMSAAAVGGGGSVNQSINAGLDANTPEGADGIVENFERMAQGDYD